MKLLTHDVFKHFHHLEIRTQWKHFRSPEIRNKYYFRVYNKIYILNLIIFAKAGEVNRELQHPHPIELGKFYQIHLGLDVARNIKFAKQVNRHLLRMTNFFQFIRLSFEEELLLNERNFHELCLLKSKNFGQHHQPTRLLMESVMFEQRNVRYFFKNY